MEYIQFEEKLKENNVFEKEDERYLFKDESFYNSLLTEVKALPFNRMTLINLFLEFSINFMNKANKTPIARGLEWYYF